MIDIENIIVNMIQQEVDDRYIARFPNFCVYSTSVEIPEGFPCVTAEITGNTTLQRTQEFGDPLEHHVSIILTINVYTNNKTGAKELAKDIFRTIDDLLQRKHFTRVMAMPMPNIDRTVSRYTGRYSAIVGRPYEVEADGETIQTFPVYRGV